MTLQYHRGKTVRLDNLRRFIVLQLLSFSFGGFVFYAGVVVPIGTRVLGSTTQGFITRDVTRVLNAAMLVCIAGLVWEAMAGRASRSAVANRVLWSLTILIAFFCLTLIALHGHLNAQLAVDDFAVNNPASFYSVHRIYLWVSTLQWLCSLPILWIVANSASRRDE
jgi:hypothetical protein